MVKTFHSVSNLLQFYSINIYTMKPSFIQKYTNTPQRPVFSLNCTLSPSRLGWPPLPNGLHNTHMVHQSDSKRTNKWLQTNQVEKCLWKHAKSKTQPCIFTLEKFHVLGTSESMQL